MKLLKIAIVTCAFLVLSACLSSKTELAPRIDKICQEYACPNATEIKLNNIIVDPDNRRWLKYRDGSPYFLAGAGDPEDFLYRGVRNPDGTRDGDQDQIIDKLAKHGVNGIYIQMIRSPGGDDRGEGNHNPFVDGDPNKALDEDILSQWDKWLKRLDENNITTFLFFYDDSARIWNKKGQGLSKQEKELIHTLVNRFKKTRNLVWVIAEEYEEAFSAEEVKEFAAHIKAFDQYEHPVAVHKLEGTDFSDFNNGDEIDQFAIQLSSETPDGFNELVNTAWNDVESAVRPYSLNLAEGHGMKTQGVGKSNWRGETGRKHAWATAFGGAYVMVLRMKVIDTAISDLKDLAHLRLFMESIPFGMMKPDNQKAAGASKYVLSSPTRHHAIYTDKKGDLGIEDLPNGSYNLHWFNPITGERVEGQLNSQGQSPINITRPKHFPNETAVYLSPLDK